ncbi:MAG: CAP domain-containing protein [Thermoanaerobaculia bacterium]
MRRGVERSAIPYAEREPAAKAVLFRRINAERTSAGLPSLRYDLFASKVGDAFCQQSAEEGWVGHWDSRGRAPYQRWGEAGGVDYHAQNVGAHTRIGAPIDDPPEKLMLESHGAMMAERPPDDGHRRTVLDPIWTHVGIGVALVAGEFRLTEEYSRHVMEWVEVPANPVPPRGAARFSAKLPRGWSAGAVEIAYEAPVQPMSAKEIGRRHSYSYPQAIHNYMPLLPAGQRWSTGDRGDFDVRSNGQLTLDVPIDHGKGNYYVLVFATPGDVSGKKISPVTAALIEAH